MYHYEVELIYIKREKLDLEDMRYQFREISRSKFLGVMGNFELDSYSPRHTGDYTESKICGNLESDQVLTKQDVVYMSKAIMEVAGNQIIQEFLNNIGSFVQGIDLTRRKNYEAA